MSSAPQERDHGRTAERYALSIPVEFRHPSGIYISAETGDISTRGMFVQTTMPLSDGERVFFRLRPKPGVMNIHIEGEVVWSQRRRPGRKTRPHGMGIRFLDIEGKLEQTLESFIAA